MSTFTRKVGRCSWAHSVRETDSKAAEAPMNIRRLSCKTALRKEYDYKPLDAVTCLRDFSRTSSPTSRRERSNAGQSSRLVAKIRSTVWRVQSGTNTFNSAGER